MRGEGSAPVRLELGALASMACLVAFGCGVGDSEPASLAEESVSEAAPLAEPQGTADDAEMEEGEAAPMPAEAPSGGFAARDGLARVVRGDRSGSGGAAARLPARPAERAQGRSERVRGAVATATPAQPASPAANIGAPPGLPQNAVLSSTFVGGSGASARLEDLLDRGVMVGGENVRLEAFDELGRLPYPVPAEEAVGLHAELERSRIHTDGERVHLQIALMARQGEAPPRPRMDVRLVLDRSGSMNGEKWEQAIAAAHQIIDRLQPSDTFGLISYSNEASLDLSPVRLGNGRAAHAAVDGLVPGGGTNIEAALRMAAANSPRRRAMNDVLLVLLVSDGVANIGQTNAEELGQLARESFDAHGVLTTSVGLGTDFDEDTMLAIAREGSGSYHFVRRAGDIGAILTDELEERAQSVAQALRLRIELADGVVATRVYGSRVLEQQEEARVRATEIATDQRLARELGISRDRQRDDDRGLRIHLPSFRRGDQHVVLMELEVPPGTRAATLANITLDYKDLLSRGNRTARVEVRGERTRDREAAVASTERTVKRTVLAFAAGDALSAAARSLEQGDVQAARQHRRAPAGAGGGGRSLERPGPRSRRAAARPLRPGARERVADLGRQLAADDGHGHEFLRRGADAMSRGIIIALALFAAAPVSAQDRWTVAHRVALPMSGAPIDLASLAGPGEEPVRIALTGSYSFAFDGSRIDAFGAHSASRSDVAEGAFVILPPGARVIARDPVAHRYELEIPRSGSMPIAFNVMPLAMRHLMTASEARASLSGAIELELLVPPAPPPPVAAVVVQEASAISPLSWAGGGLGLGALVGLGLVLARRRRDPMLALLRRARRAQRSIASECAALGPAFDPVAASTLRLFEAAERSEVHRRQVESAIARTQWATSATAERARLHEQSERARLRIVDIVTRLEQTATTLAGRRAEAASATGVDALLGELGDDLDAAVSAEEDVARI